MCFTSSYFLYPLWCSRAVINQNVQYPPMAWSRQAYQIMQEEDFFQRSIAKKENTYLLQLFVRDPIANKKQRLEPKSSISESHALSPAILISITQSFCFQIIEVITLIAAVMLSCLEHNRHSLQVELLYSSFPSRTSNLEHLLLFEPAK